MRSFINVFELRGRVFVPPFAFLKWSYVFSGLVRRWESCFLVFGVFAGVFGLSVLFPFCGLFFRFFVWFFCGFGCFAGFSLFLGLLNFWWK